jgi:hypothetical protein
MISSRFFIVSPLFYAYDGEAYINRKQKCLRIAGIEEVYSTECSVRNKPKIETADIFPSI